MYIYIHIHIHRYYNISSKIWLQHINIHIYIYIFTYIHIYTYIHIHTHICTYIHIYLYVHLYTYKYICRYYNISSRIWLQKQEFVYPKYPDNCTDDLLYIQENNQTCSNMTWPKHLDRDA
jgi:hypothetical protein